MSILDSIIEGVREDLAARRLPLHDLQEKLEHAPVPIDPHEILRGDLVSVIAEVKRSSPSKGVLADIADPASLASTYEEAGASVISVLTEKRRFGGSLEDLTAVRPAVKIPILRKDFMVDEFQIIAAKSFGADAILLIAAVLTREEIKQFSELAKSLNLEVLLEIHNQEELNKSIMPSLDLIGVNNRNLKTFDVNQA